MRIHTLVAAIALTLGYSIAALAHVTVRPHQSQPGAHEKYTVRVPTEGNSATTSVELQIPDGVKIESIDAVEGATFEAKKSGARTVAIVWTKRIEPAAVAEFTFVAQNPGATARLTWKATQHHADGSITEWAGAEGDARPASVTLISSTSATPQSSDR